MVKNIIKFISFVIILIISVSLYLSYFGIETSKFNSEIKKQIKNKYDFVDFNFNKIKLLLDLKDFSVKLQTKDIDLNIYSNKIKINKLSTKISIISYFNNKYAIENFQLKTEETEINSLLASLRSLRNELRKPDLEDNFDFEIQEFIQPEEPEIQAQAPQGGLPPTPDVNPALVQQTLPSTNVMETGLTPTEQALLSNEEKAIRLRQRGMTS